ncbi:MAG: glycine--tRNA ligase subunit alpha [Candidatus Fonsibacter ubiquis]|nr:glycine--tRNA ligase subunit alpha [Candidatus Fonsibacter ubiquis]
MVAKKKINLKKGITKKKVLIKSKSKPQDLSFQEVIFKLQKFWSDYGCVVMQPYDMEVGAGTFHPATTLRSLGPKPWKAAYVQPSRRPTDGRYGDNPNRLQHYYQFQVLIKPSPENVQSLYNFEFANADNLLKAFAMAEGECQHLLSKNLALPAYDQCLKASHIFNTLDARGVISVTERAGFINKIRTLVKSTAEVWLKNSD